MKFIAIKIHGFIDYIVGIVLIALPWIIGLDIHQPQGIVPIVLGILALVYSVFTKYELGIIRLIPMPLHLTLDILSGFVLAISPWLFGFSEEIFMPHLIVGILEILIALMTKTTTTEEPYRQDIPNF